jgi:hypothetical protein
METGEDGPHLKAAPEDVVVERKEEPDFAMIPHPQMEEKIVQERQQKVKTATHKIAQVGFYLFLSSNFHSGAKSIFLFFKLDLQ